MMIKINFFKLYNKKVIKKWIILEEILIKKCVKDYKIKKKYFII